MFSALILHLNKNYHISIAAVYTTLKQQNRLPFISMAISKCLHVEDLFFRKYHYE